ncbi:MAG TPA: class I SAM-dependent rRNA methyltransferase [Candidatus Polarisedimenticolaceae bacterium]|nr:class I SAM-dependent rRNA methyltransferase [Candidatus Polarisedimenticolaceae bacterium]
MTARGARRFRGPHPWVFRDDVADVGQAAPGDMVRVRDGEGRTLGWASYSAVSKISLRRLTRDEEPPEEALFAARAEAAVAWRRQVVTEATAFRAVHGESDGLPGLVADLYGEHLVVQVLTSGAQRLLWPVLQVLKERLPARSVLARNDPAVRTLEGLTREVVQLVGETPGRIEVEEHGVRTLVDPWQGQKTGAFLDHRENRAAAAAWAAGGEALDVFCYHGSFALHAARAGARVEAIDASEEALARGRENARLNGLGEAITFTAGNAFDVLREREAEGRRYALVFLDPPAFAKSRGDLAAARRGYKEINLRAMRLLSPGGTLVTSSCSYHMAEGDLLEVLAAAAADVGRAFRVMDRRTQSKDHPILLGFPESQYLKCLALRLM